LDKGVLMENVVQNRSNEINKRRYSSILLMCVYSTQVATAAILNNLDLITDHAPAWIVFYYVLTLLAAIPQAGFSDDSGRKKHLLIASSCVLGAVAYLLTMLSLKINTVSFSWMIFAVLPICFLLGVLGNAIPIARGCLASMKIHNFRTSIGLTSACIGLAWVTVNLLGLVLEPMGVVWFSIVLQLISLVFVWLFFNFNEKPIEKRESFFSVIYKSYKWCGTMLLVAGGAAAFSAYLLTETAFYHIYALDELREATIGKKAVGSFMGFAYLFGVIAQWIVYPSDKNSLKFGVICSFFFVFLFFLLNYHNGDGLLKEDDLLKTNGVLQFFFAFGFGFSVPALFSLMSKNVHPNHSGRLFGAVDTTDTGALGLSAASLYLKDKVRLDNSFLYSIVLILFVVSLIIYYRFIKLFKSYEKN
jgi:hypothetical protein